MSCRRRSDSHRVVPMASSDSTTKNDASVWQVTSIVSTTCSKSREQTTYIWYVLSKKSREKEHFRRSITRPIFLHSLSHFSDSKILDACCIRAPPLLLVDLVTYVLLTAATTSTDTNHHNNNEATK